MQKSLLILLCCLAFWSYSCKSSKLLTSDRSSTKEVQLLYKRLAATSGKGIITGYEDALAYGLGWWAQDGMCDMYRVTGQYPGIYGWDLGDIHEDRNLDSVSFADMRKWMKKIHANGGINTISFHMDNPIDGHSSWDTSKIVKDLLPGGKYHNLLLKQLDLAAEYIKTLKSENGQPLPIVYRPFHEHNGNWFWWGKGNASEEDYKTLFRFNVEYFRNKHGIHNLLFAFSPDRSRLKNGSDKEGYLYGYPGDQYVDILGLDNYMDVKASSNDSINVAGAKSLVACLEMVTDLAVEKGKLSALSETGSEGIKDANWFSNRILKPIKSSPKAQRISYMLFWRNFSVTHHYMSYPGHLSENDLKTFVNDPMIYTLKDIGTNFQK